MLLKHQSRVVVYLHLLVLTPFWTAPARAQSSNEFFTAGNAAARPQTIEKVVRMAVARVLNGEFSGVGMTFQTPSIQQGIDIPAPTQDLKDILSVLGVQNSVNIALSPIDAKIILPESALKIDIQKLQPNRFQVKAQWAVTRINAISEKLSLRVPKGAFDRAFEIVSSPLQIGLSAKSKPIIIELGLITDLTESGTKIHLTSLTTNINAVKNHPDFFIKLGKLTVGGKPLQLEIMSNGQRLVADEATIRAQFQQLEPGIVETVRARLKDVIREQFTKISKQIEGEAPIKFVIDSNQILSKVKGQSFANDLFKDISIQLVMSYLQYVQKSQLFTAQAASSVCFNGNTCLKNTVPASSITTDDLNGISPNESVGVLIYESWFQNFLHSKVFQQRVLDFYNKNKSPGVKIGSSGVRIHLNPLNNAIVAVINLEIDIKKTTTDDDGMMKRIKNSVGDLWENWFGTGKLVKVPVEITAKLSTIRNAETGKTEVVITPERPLKNGTFANSYHYPSNVSEMTSLVKDALLDSVDSSFCDTAEQKAADKKNKSKKTKRIKPALCEGIGEIRLPLDQVDINGFKFTPNKVVITPNRGLLMTAEMN